MSVQSNNESPNMSKDEKYKENIRNISKLFITKKFNPAFELCEKCVKDYEVNNTTNIFETIIEEEDYEEDFFLKKQREKEKEKEKKDNEDDTERSIIPSDLLQIYLKIIEQIKPETDCWEILNKHYKNVNEIPSQILTTCSLIEVKKKNLEDSKKNLKKWVNEMPKELRQKLEKKQQPDFKYYEMLIEIYVLHIMAPLEEYNSSIDFLEGEDYLTMDRKKLICDKVVKLESLKEKEKQKANNKKSEQKPGKALFSNFVESSTSSLETESPRSPNQSKETNKKSKQKRVNNKHQNKYDIGNAVIDGSYDPFWRVLSRFLIDKAPFILIVILFIVIKKNPEIIRGTIFEKILKKLYETIMMIININ